MYVTCPTRFEVHRLWPKDHKSIFFLKLTDIIHGSLFFQRTRHHSYRKVYGSSSLQMTTNHLAVKIYVAASFQMTRTHFNLARFAVTHHFK